MQWLGRHNHKTEDHDFGRCFESLRNQFGSVASCWILLILLRILQVWIGVFWCHQSLAGGEYGFTMFHTCPGAGGTRNPQTALNTRRIRKGTIYWVPAWRNFESCAQKPVTIKLTLNDSRDVILFEGHGFRIARLQNTFSLVSEDFVQERGAATPWEAWHWDEWDHSQCPEYMTLDLLILLLMQVIGFGDYGSPRLGPWHTIECLPLELKLWRYAMIMP